MSVELNPQLAGEVAAEPHGLYTSDGHANTSRLPLPPKRALRVSAMRLALTTVEARWRITGLYAVLPQQKRMERRVPMYGTGARCGAVAGHGSGARPKARSR
jgi:hypothetical protein